MWKMACVGSFPDHLATLGTVVSLPQILSLIHLQNQVLVDSRSPVGILQCKHKVTIEVTDRSQGRPHIYSKKDHRLLSLH